MLAAHGHWPTGHVSVNALTNVNGVELAAMGLWVSINRNRQYVGADSLR